MRYRGQGCLRGRASASPHDEVRDGPRYVSKRNSSVNDCRAHIAVVLMSHVPVDAPAPEGSGSSGGPCDQDVRCSSRFMRR